MSGTLGSFNILLPTEWKNQNIMQLEENMRLRIRKNPQLEK